MAVESDGVGGAFQGALDALGFSCGQHGIVDDSAGAGGAFQILLEAIVFLGRSKVRAFSDCLLWL